MNSDEKVFKMTKGVSNPIFGTQRLIVISKLYLRRKYRCLVCFYHASVTERNKI